MRRYLLGALGLVVAVIVGLVLWDLVSAGSAAERTARSGATTETTEVAARPVPIDPARRRPVPPGVAAFDAGAAGGVALVEDFGEHWTETVIAGDVPQEIMAVAASCYRDQPGKRERMTVHYTVRVRDQVATLHEVTLASSDIGDASLEQCVIDAMRGHRWELADAPDMEHPSQIAISIHDLRRRAKETPLHERAREYDEQGDDEGEGDIRPPPRPLNP